MRSAVVASSNAMLEPVPSAFQAVAVLALVLLVVAREVACLRDRDAPVVRTLARTVRIATPLILVLLAVRLWLLLQ